MNKKQRKTYTTAFKVKIAMEAINGQRIDCGAFFEN